MSAHPIIYFEGVDGTGKTTLASGLAKRINGVYLKTPPQCIYTITQRAKFSSCIETFHYHILGNIVAHYQSQELALLSPVVLDRSYYSTFANYLDNTDLIKSMPAPPSPTLIFYLSADWNVIESRLSGRADRRSHENIPNLQRIDANYRRIFESLTNVISIQTHESTVQETLDLLTQKASPFLSNAREFCSTR